MKPAVLGPCSIVANNTEQLKEDVFNRACAEKSSESVSSLYFSKSPFRQVRRTDAAVELATIPGGLNRSVQHHLI
jgi:hypothetical protein